MLGTVIQLNSTWGPDEAVRMPGAGPGLVVPSEVAASGLVALHDRRAVGFRMGLRLDGGDRRYYTHRLELVEVTAGELESGLSGAQGLSPTFDIDAETASQAPWVAIRKAATKDIGTAVLAPGEDGGHYLTAMVDPGLTDTDRVTLCWLRASLTLQDPNVLIAGALGCSLAAAATRLGRARQAELVPPARQGQRRVRR